MVGLKYFKAEPTEFARLRVGGKTVKEGEGITGIYFPFRTSIEVVPLTACEQPLAFPEITKDKQEVAVQGGFIYAIVDPQKVTKKYNFSVDPRTRAYKTDDRSKLAEHLLNLVRGETKAVVQATALEEVLTIGNDLAKRVQEGIRQFDLPATLGIAFERLYFDSIRPAPEVGRALEAEYREQLLQRADLVIYTRRAKAVENERVIKENEMKTAIAVEQEREKLIGLQTLNQLRQAEAQVKATRLQEDSRLAIMNKEGEVRNNLLEKENGLRIAFLQREAEVHKDLGPALIAAQGLQELARHIESIGDINITPDVMQALQVLVKAGR